MGGGDLSLGERLLGRPLLPGAQHSVPTLNDLGPEMLAEARMLANKSLVAAVGYLHFHVAKSVEAPDFCTDVLLGGADPATWGIKDLLCFRNVKALLSFRVSDFVEGLKGVSGERWFRLPPTADSPYSNVPGAPGVLVRSARYWWTFPSGTHSAVVDVPLERISDAELPIAVRRWIASRLAWAARDYLSQGAPSAEGLLSTLGISRDRIGEDALIALHSLVREASRPAESSLFAPGFRGPDEWCST
jgi:hypothetical protein